MGWRDGEWIKNRMRQTISGKGMIKKGDGRRHNRRGMVWKKWNGRWDEENN